MKNRVIFSIRIQFFLAFILSLAVGFFVFLAFNGAARNQEYDFSMEIASFHSGSKSVVNDLITCRTDDRKLQNLINENIDEYDIYIADSTGAILLRPFNSRVVQINLDSLQSSRSESSSIIRENMQDRNVLLYHTLVKLDDTRYAMISKLLRRSDEAKPMYLGILVFFFLFFVLSNGKVSYIKNLSGSLRRIAAGNLDYKVGVKGHDELTILAENINNMVYELKMRKTREENAERTKNELIANVSHDLKTPLTSIIGYARLLKEDGNCNDDRIKFIHIIDEKSQKLKSLIDDLFEYTTLSGGEAKPEKEDVSLNELLRQVVEGMMPVCAYHGVSVNYCAPDNEIMAYVDPAMLARVFENIIHNAAKYSRKPGEIDVRLYMDAKGPVIGVYNKGKALDEEELPRLFDRFYRTDAARNSETGGAGLGLSIAKSIVELHNGRIWAENGKDGIWFYVQLEERNAPSSITSVSHISV